MYHIKICFLSISLQIMIESFSLILLTAGKSERMGIQKANLLLNGKSFYDIIISAYKKSNITDQISVINYKLKTNERNTINNSPEKGRLFSLQLGLKEMESDWYFIQNIDNPFITTTLLNQFINCKKNKDIIQPIFKKQKGHPILISEKVKQRILNKKDYNLTLRDILSEFEKQQIEVNDESVLININTPEDYKKYCIEKVN